ncbi:hypothetical protein DXG03_007605 [Asterophora parasitica]|uniref:Uncharacterized protein n=1 Tax=Asterophora parasitica TaxID=117018 RepID=A0A9P7G4G8_9AGAR|nr:hypothetical protein DXG03_007605 [Asterophora parasitica]
MDENRYRSRDRHSSIVRGLTADTVTIANPVMMSTIANLVITLAETSLRVARSETGMPTSGTRLRHRMLCQNFEKKCATIAGVEVETRAESTNIETGTIKTPSAKLASPDQGAAVANEGLTLARPYQAPQIPFQEFLILALVLVVRFSEFRRRAPPKQTSQTAPSSPPVALKKQNSGAQQVDA